jgi:hypothetical protein
VHISDLRCAKGVGVSFGDLKVCKRSLRHFLGISMFLRCDMKVWRYIMLQYVFFGGFDVVFWYHLLGMMLRGSLGHEYYM